MFMPLFPCLPALNFSGLFWLLSVSIIGSKQNKYTLKWLHVHTHASMLLLLYQPLLSPHNSHPDRVLIKDFSALREIVYYVMYQYTRFPVVDFRGTFGGKLWTCKGFRNLGMKSMELFCCTTTCYHILCILPESEPACEIRVFRPPKVPLLCFFESSPGIHRYWCLCEL